MDDGSGRRRAVIAAVIGNAFEWYDFILYALFTPLIAPAFFPARSPVTSLLLAVATFGAGFVLRPLGAVLLGRLADRHGRRVALTLIIALMTLAVALLAFTPTYAHIGLAAPLLIVASRLLQGFSVGGELGSSTALLLESAPPHRRMLYGSLQGASQLAASLTASAAAALTAALLSPAALAAWGWRLPFMAGLLIGPVGLYLRASSVHHATRPEATPIRDLWVEHRWTVLRVTGVIAVGTACTYLLTLNMPAYAQHELHLPPAATFLSSAIATAVGIVGVLMFGALADRVGPRAVMLPATIVIGLAAYPAFLVLTALPYAATLIVIQAAFLFVSAALSGPIYGLMGAAFPASVRSSGLAIGYNLGVLVFGGFAPFVCTWLIAHTGNRHMPGAYVAFAALVTLLALSGGWVPRKQHPTA